MFLLPSLGVGLALAVLLGGRLSRLRTLPVRHGWLVLVSLAVQVVIFSRLGAGLADGTRSTLHLLTYGLLLLFAAANARTLVFLPMFAGLLLNAVAIAANGGRMPLSDAAARAAGLDDPGGNVSAGADRLRFLGDVFALPRQLPLANTFSIGDVLIGMGVISLIVLATRPAGDEPSLRLSRLARPFRRSSYRRLAAAKLLSHLGSWLTLAALVGWMYHETGSTAASAGLLLARLAPPLLGGSVAAAIVDRLPKARLLAAAELARGLAIGLALAGVLVGARPVVFAAIALSGAVAALSNAAVPALVPSILPAAELAAANAGIGIAKDAAMAVGALAAGLAVEAVGPVPALAADGATFVVAAALFARLKDRDGAAVPAGRRASGLRYLLGQRALVALVAAFSAATLATGLVNATLPRLVEDRLGLGPGGYGFAVAALAGGLAAGQALVGLTAAGPRAGRWIGVGLLTMAALLGFLGLTESAATALLALAALGVIDGTTDTLFETAVQRQADPGRYGAVFGLATTAMSTTMMAAIAAAPLVNGALPTEAVMGVAAALVCGAGIMALGPAAGIRAGMGRARAGVSFLLEAPAYRAAGPGPGPGGPDRAPLPGDERAQA